jgi:hypothetical protein
MSYPRTLDGLPSEAREVILEAVAVMERLSDDVLAGRRVVAYRRPLTDDEADRKRPERLRARFSGTPADRDLFDRPARHEVNARAIKENKPLIGIG